MADGLVDNGGHRTDERCVELERKLEDLRGVVERQERIIKEEKERAEASAERYQQLEADLALFTRVTENGAATARMFEVAMANGKDAMMRNQSERRAAFFRTAALLRPSDGEAWRSYAASLHDLGDHAAAVAAWRKAIGLDQADAVASHGLGQSLAALGLQTDAHRAMQAAFAIDPGLPGLGDQLVAEGVDPGRLVDSVLSSRSSRGTPGRKRLPMGIRHFSSLRKARHAVTRGNPRKAARLFAALAAQSDNPAELLHYGDSIAALVGPQAARDVYLKAFAIAPDDRRAHRRAIDAKLRMNGFVVRPKVDLQANDDGTYVTLSDDAQLRLDPDGRAYPAGWTLISISAEAPISPIRPVIYAFHGDGGGHVTAFTFPAIEGWGEVRCLLPLPHGITDLRLDPTGHAGVLFRLDRVDWSNDSSLEGHLFVPAPAADAFVGENPSTVADVEPAADALVLHPQHDIATLADGSFVSTGQDPQFDVVKAGHVLGGWTWIDLTINGVTTPLDPVLYAWTEGEVVTIRLPEMRSSGTIRGLVRLPERLTQLRFDPATREGVRFETVVLRAGAMSTVDCVFMSYSGNADLQPTLGSPDAISGSFGYVVAAGEQLEALNGGRFRTLDAAPRFDLIGENHPLPGGLVRLTLQIDEADQTIDATLYAYGDIQDAPISYRLGDVEPGRTYDYDIVLPPVTRSLQLRPGSVRDISLTLPTIALLPLGANDDASYMVARHQDDILQEGPDTLSTELHPLQHMERQGTEFVSTGHDPQFRVTCAEAAFPHGWTVVTVEMDVPDTVARPVLYVWSGDDVTPIQLASLGQDGRSRQLIHLPDDVTAMRFDPTDVAGTRFAVPQMSFSPAALFAGRLLTRIPNAGARVDYEAWCELYDRIGPVDRVLIAEAIDRFAQRPLISVLMPVYDPEPRFLRRALDTVIDQIYPHWELCIAEDCSPNEEIRRILREYAALDDRIKVVFRTDNGHISKASNSALEIVTGPFVALMDHDDELPPHALYMVADQINRFPATDIIYTDEDKIDQNGRRHDPYFKNDWNQELFYSQNCVAHLGVYRTSLMRAVEGFRPGFEGSQDYDLTLRVLRLTSPERIRHIPHILYHWRIFEGVRTFSSNNPSRSIDTAARAMNDYFEQVEPDSDVLPIPFFPGWWRIKRPLPAKPPAVSIIIPTRDRIELVRNCVEGILNRTDYPAIDVILVDNGSVNPESLNYFTMISRDARVSVLRDDGPFNYSRLNNVAVARAKGDYICFLNNDIETISPDWLSEMVSQVLRPDVGAVGTRLLYASGTLQHAGVTLGVYGIAAHSHRHFPGDTIGYFGHPQLVREVSAVTAAALLMPKDLFQAIGGFDEDNLAVSYNDVDLCLRIREAGRKVIYTPFAALYHLESATRGPDVTFEQQEAQRVERGYMAARWERVLAQDPFYSRNLTVTTEDCNLAFPPRAARPWLEEADVAERLARLGQAALPSIDAATLSSLAADTVIVIANALPFDMLAALADDMADHGLVPSAIILVDNMPHDDAFVGKGRVAAFREAFPQLALRIVDDPGQDFNVARTANLGLADLLSDQGHVLLITEDCRLTRGWFHYMLRAWLTINDPNAVLSPGMFIREGRPRNAVFTNGYLETPVAQTARTPADVKDLGDSYAALPANGRQAPADVHAGQALEETERAASGIIFSRLATLKSADDRVARPVFDTLYLTRSATFEDLIRTLSSDGVRCYATLAALGILPAPRSRDISQLWQFQHDYRWLNRKAHGATDDGTVEFICPFHRGDVLVGLQVAHSAFLAGCPIRLHVAESLLDWVRDFDPPFPVRGVPVKIPSAEETALCLLRAYEHVVRQPDTAPRIARSHFARGFDAMDSNLVTAMLSSVGLSPDTPLDNLRPSVTDRQEREATGLLAPYGTKTVLFHRTGGWGLKSLPDTVLAEFAAVVSVEDFKLIQIGGPGEQPCPEADGMIAGNFAPGLWAALFRQAGAVAGVDSWTAHMAALLDVPQITFFGSTHPDHVASKPYFRDKTAPALLIPPTVACSPCNSLVCLIRPQPFCMGYSVDAGKIARFLRELPSKSDDGLPQGQLIGPGIDPIFGTGHATPVIVDRGSFD